MENENLTYFNISYKGTHALLGCSLKSATTYLHENKQWPASLGNSLVFNVHFLLFKALRIILVIAEKCSIQA